MFWGFGYQNQSAIDGILDKPDVTLEILIEEEDIIPECKGHNTKLIEFLAQPDNLSRMIELVTFGDDNYDESKQFKYSLICTEIICCELWPILDGLANHPEILERFWSFIEADESLIPYRANCFSRICVVLIQTKPQVMINYIKNKENSITNILKHIENSSISDLLLKLMLIEDIDNTYQIFEWLRDEHVISQLIDRLNPYNDPEQHSLVIQILLEINALNYNQVVMATMTENVIATGEDGSILSLTQPKTINKVALLDEIKEEKTFTRLINYMFDNDAPNSTSSLINGINIIIELIRKYCSDIEQIEFQYHQFKLSKENNSGNNNAKNTPPQVEEVAKPSDEQLYMLGTSINTILHIINTRLFDFKYLLSHPKSITGPVDTTIGKQIPLGQERLRICELFAEVMHLQYLFTSSPLFGEVVNSKAPENSDNNSSIGTKKPIRTIVDELVEIGNSFTELNILPICLKLFFDFPWNNFLHSVVFDMIAKIFNTYIYSLENPYSIFENSNDVSIPNNYFNNGNPNTPENEDEECLKLSQEKMSMIRKYSYKLTISILKEGELTKKIVKAQRLNDFEVEQPRGIRLGYMGYITHISDEICKLIDTTGSALNKSLGKTLKNEGWIEYASKILPETKFQDCQPLGGERPNNTTLLFRTNPFEVAGDVDNIGNVLNDVDGLDMNEPNVEPGYSSSNSLGSDSMTSKDSSVISSVNSEKMTVSNNNNSSVSQIPISTSEYLASSHNSLNKSWSNITSTVGGSSSSLNFNSTNNLHTISATTTTTTTQSSHTTPTGSKNNSLSKINKKSEKESNSDDEDDDIEGFGNVSVMNNIRSDQFARYICQQVVNDLPGKFLVDDNSDSSDTDEELEWLKTIENNEECYQDSENKVSHNHLDIPESKYNFDNLSAVDIRENNSDLIFPQLKDTFETNELREALNSINGSNN
ncbi:SAPS-domain-containing protein [Piromyces finnis]|uniref:SAPS-domain-containing protein n=1 Tax=Piromyces finnis TaxID=1754191 RepID=A0A1Y1V6J3_9FUNG|nr:SAPS-domain-containing protein [Piromyces finnis]|eukprot:ORX48429.1 SAPS-domain-containing protein [Piromyces finnis]